MKQCKHLKVWFKNYLNIAFQIKNRFGWFSLFFILLSFAAYAQDNTTVTGNVKSSDMVPLAGATIMEKGTNNGTQTDFDGNYSLKVSSPDATVVTTYVGFISEQRKVGDNTVIDFVLSENNTQLDEVVVTALGIKRETRALGYAVSKVDGDVLNSGRQTNAIQALSGKVAGVDISTTTAGPSGSTRVVIRGNSELTGSNNPLYVVDGVPIDNTQLGGAGKWGGYDYGDGLSSILPENIESVSVLKGASAAALYGSRATNGVILITTKSGNRKSGIGVEYSSSVNVVELLSSFDDYQRTYGQGRDGIPPTSVSTGQGTTQVAWGSKLDPSIQTYIYNGERKPYQNVPNNVLSFFRTGLGVNNSVSLTGTNGFRASVSDMKYEDIVPNSDMRRNTFMVKGSSELGKSITVEGKVNYTREKVHNRPALSDSPNNIGNAIIGLAPNFDQKWLNENYKDQYGRYVDWNGGNIYRINPYWAINEMSNESIRNRVNGYLLFRYQITPELSIQLRGGTDFYDFKVEEYNPFDTPTASSGSFKLTQTNVREDNAEALLRFNKEFGKFSVSAFTGGNIRYYENETYIHEGSDEVQPDLKSVLNYRETTLVANNYRKQVNSLYGSINLGYDDFAYIDFSMRNDVSSTLSADNRSYFYPSFSGSLVFSNLLNLDNSILNFGKVRASWAQVGGDTGPYNLDLYYGLYPYTFNGNALGDIKSGVIPNRNLKPTRTRSYEFGTDLHFFNGRLNIDAGYYHESTTDQILNLSTSSTTGYNSATINSGEITNYGFELSLFGAPIQTQDFEWNATLNFARNVNEVVKLHPSVKTYELGAARWAGAFIHAAEGEAYGTIVGKGFKRTDDGQIIYQNGLPTYDNELKTLGNGVPDFTLGLNQTFRYKNFSLRVLFDMKWGMDIYSMSSYQAHANGTSEATLEGRAQWYASEEQRLAAGAPETEWVPKGGYLGEGVKNIGTEDEPQYVPNDVYVNPQDYWTNVGSNTPEPFIYDDSFIKLRELNLSYNLSKKSLEKTPIQSLTISLYGSNLAILYSKVKNIDPESNYNTSNGQGLEYGSLPSRRNFGLGLNIKF